MNRRQFLRFLSLAGFSALALPTRAEAQEPLRKPVRDWGQLPPRVFNDRMHVPPVVGTSHAGDPGSFNVEQLVREAVEWAGGFDKVIRPGDTVLVKPNLVTNLPSGAGFTTDRRVAEAVVKMALDCGAKRIVFAEGSSVNHPVSRYGEWSRDRTALCFEAGGFGELAKKYGAVLVDLNAAGKKENGRELVRNVEIEHGLKSKSYWISKTFLDVDRVISVPVLKNHELAGVTLSLKNYIGLAPADIYRAPGRIQGKAGLDHTNVGLAKHIVDLVMIRPPDYAVVDALVGVNSGVRVYPFRPGPKGPMRAVIAGRDPVAVDTVACLAMNYDPVTIGHIVYASAVGLGICDPGKIEIRGTGIEPFRQDFQTPVNGAYTPGRLGRRTSGQVAHA